MFLFDLDSATQTTLNDSPALQIDFEILNQSQTISAKSLQTLTNDERNELANFKL